MLRVEIRLVDESREPPSQLAETSLALANLPLAKRVFQATAATLMEASQRKRKRNASAKPAQA